MTCRPRAEGAGERSLRPSPRPPSGPPRPFPGGRKGNLRFAPPIQCLRSLRFALQQITLPGWELDQRSGFWREFAPAAFRGREDLGGEGSKFVSSFSRSATKNDKHLI